MLLPRFDGTIQRRNWPRSALGVPSAHLAGPIATRDDVGVPLANSGESLPRQPIVAELCSWIGVPFGYLIIFKACDEDFKVALTEEGS